MSDKAFPKLVLVVDDEPAIQKLMQIQLESFGYAVLLAATGGAAVERAKTAKVDVVFTDLGLPDINGLEVLKRIKAAKPAVPVIIVTGNHQEEEGRRALELGALEYLTKPID